MEIEDSGFNNEISDKAYVVASIDGGETWNELWRNPVTPDPNNETVYRTNDWEQVILNLDKYNGKSSVLIRWRFITNHNVSYAGWYIDDVSVFGRAPLKNDAGIESIDSPDPDTHIAPGRTAQIKATVMNYGTNNLINCKVVLEIYETLSGDPAIAPQEKYVGTVANPIETGETAQVEFEWQVSDKFLSMDYDIHVYTCDKYIDGNNEKTITVRAQTDIDIAVESISIFPRITDRGNPRIVTAIIANRGNQEEKFNITLEVKWRQDDTDWEDIEADANPFMEQIQLDAGEVMDNWNTTYFPEVHAEYLITVKACTVFLSYDYKSGLPIDDPKAWTIWENDFKPENNFMSITFKGAIILWEDYMEWGPDEENGDWTHNPVNLSEYDDWHIEEGGYHGSDWSWRCGQGNWTDPYHERLYHDNMNAVLTSPRIELVTEKVERGLGISFWMKYIIEPMDTRGKYQDNLFLEYLPEDGNPDVNDDWEAIYIKDYDHSPFKIDFWDARLFWPKDGGPDTSNSDDYPGNEHGWIYQQIIFDEVDPDTGENIYVKKDGVSEIDDWLWNGFQFRFRFETDSNIHYTGPWIDNVAVFGYVEIYVPPINKFMANWTDLANNNYEAYSLNIIESIPSLTLLDNVLPSRDAGSVLFNDDDHNTVWFWSSSACPWHGKYGLSYKWDFNDLVDSDGDGNHINDDDSGDDRFTMIDDKGAWVTWKFNEFGTFKVTLWVTDKDEMTTFDSLVVRCGDNPIYNVEIEVEEIRETDDSVESVNNLYKYGSGDNWAIWQGDVITLSAAGGIDPEKISSDQFKYKWAVIEGKGEDALWKDLIWETTEKRGVANKEFTYQEHFKRPGNFTIIVDVDDGSNFLRYWTNVPENLGWEVLSSYSWSWLDWINITVLPFVIESTMNSPVYIFDWEGEVVEVYYEVAYQASTNTSLLDKLTKGTVDVIKTNEPEDSETLNNLNVFVDFTTKNMYDENGEKGFVWAHIIIIIPKHNLPDQLQLEEPDPNHDRGVVLLYYWDITHRTWIKCENTNGLTNGRFNGETAVEANVTHFTILAPMINFEYDGGIDPSIESKDIWLSNPNPVENQKVTIYATIRNYGLLSTKELEVRFKDGNILIGDIKISIILGNGSKDISINWIPKIPGFHNITIELDLYNKIDEPEHNNIAKIQVYVDKDTDGDGIGNIEDEDDDNDGFTDLEEQIAGTDPLDPYDYPRKNPKEEKNYLLLFILLFGIIVIVGTIIFISYPFGSSMNKIPPEFTQLKMKQFPTKPYWEKNKLPYKSPEQHPPTDMQKSSQDDLKLRQKQKKNNRIDEGFLK